MKLILFILLSFTCVAQSPENIFDNIPDDVKHFYGSCFVNETAYQTEKLLFPDMKPGPRLLISSIVTAGVGLGKEQFDKTRCNRSKRTGFSKDDLFVDLWSIPVYAIVRTCLNDFRKPEEIIIDPFTDQKINIPPHHRKRIRKWSLKKQGLLT